MKDHPNQAIKASKKEISKQKANRVSKHEERADKLPFFLRRWWLRDWQEEQDFPYQEDELVTGPIWSLYSDPLCDVGSLDWGDAL